MSWAASLCIALHDMWRQAQVDGIFGLLWPDDQLILERNIEKHRGQGAFLWVSWRLYWGSQFYQVPFVTCHPLLPQIRLSEVAIMYAFSSAAFIKLWCPQTLFHILNSLVYSIWDHLCFFLESVAVVSPVHMWSSLLYTHVHHPCEVLVKPYVFII